MINDIFLYIYDLMRNLWKWSTEYNSESPCVYIGGNYIDSNVSPSTRTKGSTSLDYKNIGFRVQLYVK